MVSKVILVYSLCALWSMRAQGILTPAETVASLYSLTTSTSIPFPSPTLATADASNFILQNNWSLSKGRIQNGANDTAFMTDPFPNSPAPGLVPINTNTSVLQVTYPAGGISPTDGLQLYSLWNTTAPLNSMLLSYEVAFDSGFDWVKGGKLPGIRGGPNPLGCSGGNQPNGTDCFSTRMMWRTNGQAEVYAYIPTPNGLCNNNGILCNDDYGVSIQRGSFSWVSGQWNRITMLVQMNNPPNIANGNLQLYFNDVKAISQTNLQFRSSNIVSAGGLYISTFFGGSDLSWAPPATTHSYFRNFRLWGSTSPSNLTGAVVSAATSTHGAPGMTWMVCTFGFAAALATTGI